MTEPVTVIDDPTPWERAHDLTDAKRYLSIDPSVITKVKDALLCDEIFLMVLGWERSADLWFDDWGIEKRRYVVDKWFEFERLKGTPEGFRRFYELVGAKLLKVTSPPQMLYARAGWTQAERDAYLRQFQQIRIYPKVPVREFQRGFFASSLERSKA